MINYNIPVLKDSSNSLDSVEKDYLLKLTSSEIIEIPGEIYIKTKTFVDDSTYIMAMGAKKSGSLLYVIDPFSEFDNKEIAYNFSKKMEKYLDDGVFTNDHVEKTWNNDVGLIFAKKNEKPILYYTNWDNYLDFLELDKEDTMTAFKRKIDEFKDIGILIHGSNYHLNQILNKNIGLLFIDGKKGAINNFMDWEKWLSYGSIIVWTDTNYPEFGDEKATRLVKRLIQNYNEYECGDFNLEVIDKVNSITCVRKVKK